MTEKASKDIEERDMQNKSVDNSILIISGYQHREGLIDMSLLEVEQQLWVLIYICNEQIRLLHNIIELMGKYQRIKSRQECRWSRMGIGFLCNESQVEVNCWITTVSERRPVFALVSLFEAPFVHSVYTVYLLCLLQPTCTLYTTAINIAYHVIIGERNSIKRWCWSLYSDRVFSDSRRSWHVQSQRYGVNFISNSCNWRDCQSNSDKDNKNVCWQACWVSYCNYEVFLV